LFGLDRQNSDMFIRRSGMKPMQSSSKRPQRNAAPWIKFKAHYWAFFAGGKLTIGYQVRCEPIK
jgi:hypothetical protein